jgi:type I restriction enzyme R subunit
MNETETRAELIDPVLRTAGWGVVEGSRIRMEFPINKGRLIGHGQRSKPDKADYVLQYKNRKIQSFFVFDTGAPEVYLCERTLKALGIDYAEHANILEHRQLTAVFRSSGHFQEVNIIGASYFLENRLRMEVNYHSRKLLVDRARTLTEEEDAEV